jgi:hypothetical protein
MSRSFNATIIHRHSIIILNISLSIISGEFKESCGHKFFPPGHARDLERDHDDQQVLTIFEWHFQEI